MVDSVLLASLDWARVHAIASERLDDLLAFCDALSRSAD
jgi:hypothetical protein